MRKSIVKQNLREGKPCLFTVAHFTDPSIYEIISLSGYHCIWMDMEHHAYTVQTADNLMRATRVGDIDIMARCAKWEYMRLGRMLEAGATGVLYPRCESPEEAAEVVKWSKFAPMGTRGGDGGNPDMPYLSMQIPEYIRMANEETFIGVQIEDEGALAKAEEILAVEGVDFLFLGPGDFSILSGIPGDMGHPKIQNAMETISRAARNTGKDWGRPVGTVEQAKEIMDLGAKIISCGADIVMYRQALDKLQKDFEDIGFSFKRLMPPM